MAFIENTIHAFIIIAMVNELYSDHNNPTISPFSVAWRF